MKVFVLTGAGISAESGLGTFRDKGGTWAKFDPRRLATPEAFARDPVLVHDFYSMRRRTLLGAEPNAAHAALAQLAASVDLFLCTQNIDDLHERAGSPRVHHMHGSLLHARCGACAGLVDWRADLSMATACPFCARAGVMRPDVVWFGEMPVGMPEIEAAIASADLFVSIGTSGSVYPAAGFVRLARAAGAETCEINLEPSETARLFDRHILGPATLVVPDFVAELTGPRDGAL